MKNKQGFTLIELIVTIGIMGIVIALTAPVFKTLLDGVKKETVSSEVYQDLINSQELIRLDIEHTGVGIARNETIMPVSWDEPTKTLELRSTLNNTNQNSMMGWALIDCTSTGLISGKYIINMKGTPGYQSMVLLKGYDPGEAYKNFGGLTTSTNYDSFNCPATPEIYSAYPYDATVSNGCTGGIGSWCTKITYVMSAAANGVSSSRAACAQGTFNLLRKVGAGTGKTIINCVADFRVRFDIDNNADDRIATSTETDLTTVPKPATAGPQMDAIKNIEFLLLVQTGQRDDNLTSSPNTTVSGVTLSSAGVTNFNNYRWKIIKISGKPMSM